LKQSCAILSLALANLSPSNTWQAVLGQDASPKNIEWFISSAMTVLTFSKHVTITEIFSAPPPMGKSDGVRSDIRTFIQFITYCFYSLYQPRIGLRLP